MSNLIFSQNSEIRKFKSGIPLEKRLGKFITGKCLSSPQHLVTFPKKCIQKLMILAAKSLKNT